MLDQETLANIRTSCEGVNLVTLRRTDFLQLVADSGTDSEGFVKAASSLKDSTAVEVTVLSAQLVEMLDKLTTSPSGKRKSVEPPPAV